MIWLIDRQRGLFRSHHNGLNAARRKDAISDRTKSAPEVETAGIATVPGNGPRLLPGLPPKPGP